MWSTKGISKKKRLLIHRQGKFNRDGGQLKAYKGHRHFLMYMKGKAMKIVAT